MYNWDEIRTAFHVARLGTVSGAADMMGVHHATVIRHIDALEKQLGAKLFQRHARGYTPTEAGRDLLSVAQTTDEQFSQLASRIKGHGETVSGELVITSITGFSGMLVPVLAGFQALYPDLTVRFLTDMRVYRLDYGEAHVAIRAGVIPQEPDNVVQPFLKLRTGLYASRDYVAKHGTPVGLEDLKHHRFIGSDEVENRAPFYLWQRKNIPDAAISFRVNDITATQSAVRAGAGIGFLAVQEASRDPELVEVMPSIPEWEAPLWLVTHVDLHRTLKVQKFLAYLKAAVATWTCA
jgi:DNA-binding transcriptional LysR family regulator